MLVKISFDSGLTQFCEPSDMVRVINKAIEEGKKLKSINFFKKIDDFEGEQY